jgi:hypothetical protein
VLRVLQGWECFGVLRVLRGAESASGLGVLRGVESASGCWECFGVLGVLWGAGSASGSWEHRAQYTHSTEPTQNTVHNQHRAQHGISTCFETCASGDTNEYSK